MYIRALTYQDISAASFIDIKNNITIGDNGKISDAAPERTGEYSGNTSPASQNSNQVNEKNSKITVNPANLSLAEQQIVMKLRQRDTQVRQHEMAHIAAGGQYVTGGPQYEYAKGPDGKMYAVGGEVSIDASPVPGNPDATAEKARIIKRAALAPANPSPQDVKVAAQADNMLQKALHDKMEQQLAKMKKEDSGGGSLSASAMKGIDMFV